MNFLLVYTFSHHYNEFLVVYSSILSKIIKNSEIQKFRKLKTKTIFNLTSYIIYWFIPFRIKIYQFLHKFIYLFLDNILCDYDNLTLSVSTSSRISLIVSSSPIPYSFMAYLNSSLVINLVQKKIVNRNESKICKPLVFGACYVC